jgi:hypothetical protein
MIRLLTAGLVCLATVCHVPAQQPGTPPTRSEALERALQNLDQNPPPAAGPAQSVTPSPAPGQRGELRLTDLSLDITGAVGGSTERDAVLDHLQGGGHDPRKRGFTLGQAELSVGGAVDPYFTAEAHIVYFIDPIPGTSEVELEEAFFTSQALPADLQIKAGQYLTEFGRINPTHPHAWDWQDQPLIITRVFGADGMRAPGARLSWLLPTDNYTEALIGVQNANGDQMTSFLSNAEAYADRPVGGRQFVQRDVRSAGDMLWSARLMTSFDLSDTSSTAFGVSVAFGPNATGDGADTAIYGADFVYKWRPLSTERGWPFFKLQGEVIGRSFQAAAQTDASVPGSPVAVPGTTLHDYGGYLQALYGFTPGWDVGLRGDWVSGSGSSYDQATQTFSRSGDMFRADRWRISPILTFHPSEFSRFRIQYNYDDTDALGSPAQSVWIGFEVLIGKHPPHKY